MHAGYVLSGLSHQKLIRHDIRSCDTTYAPAEDLRCYRVMPCGRVFHSTSTTKYRSRFEKRAQKGANRGSFCACFESVVRLELPRSERVLRNNSKLQQSRAQEAALAGLENSQCHGST